MTQETESQAVQRLKQNILSEGRFDQIGLWELVSDLRHHQGIQDLDEIKVICLRTIRELLEEGLCEAGDFLGKKGPKIFESWSLPVAEALDWIQTEWSQLKKDPSLGDVVFLRLTPKGREHGKEFSLIWSRP